MPHYSLALKLYIGFRIARISTVSPIHSTISSIGLVDDGAFAAKDLLEAIEDLENMNYLHCPVLAVGEDKKTVTIHYCAEAKANTKAIVRNKTVTITNVTHEEGEPDEITGEKQLETTVISTSAMVSVDATEIAVTAPYTIYDSLGMTAEELNQIKEELANE